VEKNRLAEALKKHQLLVEYNFYIPNGMDEQETPPADLPGGETPVETPEAPTEPTGEPASPESTPDLSAAQPTTPEPTPNEKGEVELDVTDLVNSTKDTKDKIDGINELLNNLMGKFDEFETKMSSFDQILGKIDSLEKDLDKRIPTPVEKLEMRSMDSYPYSVKLSDYWKDEVEEIEDGEGKEDNYTLTDDDIKKDYSPSDIKTSFDIQKPEDQSFKN
jgi:hypothetical protein